jgi:aspartate kinase
VLKDMAIDSAIRSEMRHMVGLAGRMFTCLAGAGVNIEMISQGAREINIWCVIHLEAVLEAVGVVHEKCILGASLMK